MIRNITAAVSVLIILNANGQNVLKLTAGVTLKTTGNALVTIENMDLENDGFISTSYATPPGGISTFRFSGNINSKISGTSSVTAFDRLEIVKGGGVLQLMQNIYIASVISFGSGLLDLNNHNIALFRLAGVSGETESSRIIGPAGGYVEIRAFIPPNSLRNPGNLGATIYSSQDLGYSTIRRGHQSQLIPNGTGKSVLRYYEIIPQINTSSNASLRFNYLNAELNGLNENDIVLWKDPVSSLGWMNQGFTIRDATNNYVEHSWIVADSARWTLSHSYAARPAKPLQPGPKNIPASRYETNGWKIWPNPVMNSLWIDIAATGVSRAITNIFDSKGALILTQQDHLSHGRNLINMDMKALPAGNYYILITWDNGQVRKHARFVKQ